MQIRNIGAYIAPRYAGSVAVTAGGAADGAEVDGIWIDTDGFFSARVVVGYTTTLADAESLTLAANVQDATASDGTGAADYGAVYASAVQVTSSGGTTETGQAVFDIDFLGGTQGAADGTPMNRYMRVQFTPTMSASGTDTARVSAYVILGGAVDQPAS
jgi:hypothetical protein